MQFSFDFTPWLLSGRLRDSFRDKKIPYKVAYDEHHDYWDGPRPAGPKTFRQALGDNTSNRSGCESADPSCNHPAVPVHRRTGLRRFDKKSELVEHWMVGEDCIVVVQGKDIGDGVNHREGSCENWKLARRSH